MTHSSNWTGSGGASYDVSPEGGFLMVLGEGAGGSGDLVLVRNWVKEVTGGR